MILGEQSAFPLIENRNPHSGDIYIDAERGMTLREYVAAQIIGPVTAKICDQRISGMDEKNYGKVAATLTLYATDALIAELSKEKK